WPQRLKLHRVSSMSPPLPPGLGRSKSSQNAGACSPQLPGGERGGTWVGTPALPPELAVELTPPEAAAPVCGDVPQPAHQTASATQSQSVRVVAGKSRARARREVMSSK